MGKTATELQCELRTVESRLLGKKASMGSFKGEIKDFLKRISDLETEIIGLNMQREKILQDLSKNREILDCDAPHSMHTWTAFDKDLLADHLKDFIYDRAKHLGRSTSSIRYKVAEIIVHTINATDWHRIKKEDR